MQHKPLFKRYFIPSLLFVASCVAGFFAVYFLVDLFQVKKVQVFGASSEEGKIILRLIRGKSTILFNQKEIASAIHSRYPAMKIKNVYVQYPYTLEILVEKEKPLAYLRSDSGYIALSKKGTVISKERSETVPAPAISFYQVIHHLEYQVGQGIGFTAIERALLFVSLLAEEGYQTETVAIDSVDMIACKTKGFEVAFSQTRPIDLQSHELSQIVRQIRAGAFRIVRLDLRFDKPVVQLPKK